MAASRRPRLLLALLCPGLGAAGIVGDGHFPIVYVVYGPGGLPVARAVVPAGEACPALSPPDVVGAQVRLRAEGTDAMPFAFPVRVCEVELPRDLPANSLSFGGKALPATTSRPSSFVLIGDTGMRTKGKNLGTCTKFSHEKLYGITQCAETVPFNASLIKGEYQAMADWPLESIMDRAAAEHPDVVVHVGDYLYRQSPCAQGMGCEAINNVTHVSVPGDWGDNWKGWYADFFEPSASLLSAAPWIALRGNHESCGRGGHGYFLFLDPRPLPMNWTGDYCPERTDAYAVTFEGEQFLVIDDNFIDDLRIDGDCPAHGGADQGKAQHQSRYDDPAQNKDHISEEVDYFAGQFQKLEELSKTHATNFYLGHHPLLNVGCHKQQYVAADWTLQTALARNPAALSRVSATITGHVHMFQGLVFENYALPVSLLVGNGGTLLQETRPVSADAVDGLEVFGGAKVESSFTMGGVFGFSAMTRSPEGGGFRVRSVQAGNDGLEASDVWTTTVPAERGVRRLQAEGRAEGASSGAPLFFA